MSQTSIEVSGEVCCSEVRVRCSEVQLVEFVVVRSAWQVAKFVVVRSSWPSLLL